MGRRRFLLCLVVGLVGIAVSWSLARLLREQERRLSAVQFQHDAEKRIEAIQRAAIDRLSVIDILEAFYAGSVLVERKEFHTFAGPLLQRLQGLHTLGWAPLVDAADRQAYERAVREEGLPHYRITEQDNQGRFVPAGQRADYCPILFIEPSDTSKSLLGFDLRSDRACRAATDRSMTTGRQSAAVCSPAGKGAAVGRLLYVFAPIREKNPRGNDAAGKSETEGFVFGIFNIDEIVGAALAPFAPVGIDVHIRDPAEAAGEQPICARPSPLRAPKMEAERAPGPSELSPAPMRVARIIEIADRQGVLECVPLEVFFAQRRTWGPAATLLTGLLITALLAGFVFMLTGRTAHVRRLVAQRTQELRASEQRFRRLVDNAGDIIILHDLQGNIRDANKRTSDMLDFTREELLAMNISEIDARFIDGNLSQYWILPDKQYPVSFEGVHRRKDGTTFPVEVRLVPLNVGEERLMLGMARDITDRKQAEEKLYKEQRLLREMLDLQEQDRKLVAYEIHDGLAQQLTGAMMKFQSIAHLRGDDPAAAEKMFDEALGLLRDAMAETRRLIGGLRPLVLDESGIVAAVEGLIAGHRQAGGPQIEFVHSPAIRRFAPPLESAMFRIAQESLSNACRHGRSEKVRVELGLSDDRIWIDVRDWGVGFVLEQVQEGRFGLRGIRERTRLLGGTAEIESAPGRGTHVRVELPAFLPVENGAELFPSRINAIEE